MEDRNLIKEKALRVALRTGMAPDLELIWEAQDHAGTQRCFGAFRSECSARCRWYERCRLVSAEPIELPRPDRMAPSEGIAEGAERPGPRRWIAASARHGGNPVRGRPPL